MLTDLRLRLRAIFCRRQVERELEEELEFHLERQAEKNRLRGMEPTIAWREARIALGGEEQTKEACRAANGTALFDTLAKDLSYALRAARRNPGFSLLSLSILAAGIGMCAILFSLLDALWFRPLPFVEPARLVAVWERPPRSAQWKRQTLPIADFLELQRHSRSFETLAGAAPSPYATVINQAAESLSGERVSPGYLAMLGIPALIGRTFLPGDEPGAPLAVLSYGLWRRLGSKRDIVGQSLQLNSRAHSIIGVMPPEYPFPSLEEGPPDIWTLLGPADAGRLSVVGRLRPAASSEAAESEVAALLRESHARIASESRPSGMIVRTLQQDRAEPARPAAAAISGAVALILLIACANVAGLLLGRGVERQHEIAVRYSLGASRSRIVGQLLIENLLLWFTAGAAGVALAVEGIGMLSAPGARILGAFPAVHSLAVDWRCLACAFGVTLLTGVLFGALPAFQSSRRDPAAALRQSGRGLILPRGMRRWGRTLVAGEAAISVVLLVSAGLLLRSAVRLSAQPLGFRPAGLLTFRVESMELRDRQWPDRQNFFDRVLAAVRVLPGVQAAGATSSLPLQGTVVGPCRLFDRAGSAEPMAAAVAVSADYFRTLGVALIAGRTLNAHDTELADRVVVISEEMARRHFQGQNAVGQRINWGNSAAPLWSTVVGVVGNVKYAGLDWDLLPTVYLPYRQLAPENRGLTAHMSFVLRTAGGRFLRNDVQRIVRSLDPAVPVVDLMSMEDIVAGKTLPARVSAAAFSAFAAASLLLAAIGLYALVSQSVSRRRKEIAIRIALGAAPGRVIRQTVSDGVQLGIVGAAAGVAAAIPLARLMRNLLFGVSPVDAAVLVACPLVLVLVCAAASLAPALRARATDPLDALRCD
ncbi:MAG TPA: ABC transporter permease [Bryobacteraceae bacterium]|nr:ABC transporter permease [Bryobacteraceae bacterium]